MAHSVLGSVRLTYQLVWNALREVAGVRLFIEPDEAIPVDATHLLAALDEAWSGQAPQLIVSVSSAALLADLLRHASADGPWLEVASPLLRDPALLQRSCQAHQRGVHLIWRGEPGTQPNAVLAPFFSRTLVTLSVEQALMALHATLRPAQESPGATDRATARAASPVQPGNLCESVASRALIAHCLDQQGAWGLAGWPTEDVLHSHRNRTIQPDQRTLSALLTAIRADESVDRIEQILSEEPILSYWFLRYVNSAAIGLRADIESLRHGLMVLGLTKLRHWLQTQTLRGVVDLDLAPPRAALVLRASLMAHLMDAGESDNLRREIYLCGLLSQIDLLTGEPLATALARLPLSERITSAILTQSGPYLPYLEVATSLEAGASTSTLTLCETHQMDLGDVNRALLRTLTQTRQHPTPGLLLV